jgi:hypothetical protein
MSKSKPDKETELIEITGKDGAEILERLESKAFTEQDYEILKWLLRTFFKLHLLLQKKSIAIKRLKRIIFIKTEKTKSLVKETDSEEEESGAEPGKESNQSPMSNGTRKSGGNISQ